MELVLDKSKFENNIFSQVTESNCIVVFNSVQEHISYGGKDCIIDTINVQLTQDEGSIRYYRTLPSIIGYSDDFISIRSSYKELLGEPLSLENIDKCVITVTEKRLKDV